MEVDVMTAVNMVMMVNGAQVFTGTQLGDDAANAVVAAVSAAAAVLMSLCLDVTLVVCGLFNRIFVHSHKICAYS